MSGLLGRGAGAGGVDERALGGSTAGGSGLDTLLTLSPDGVAVGVPDAARCFKFESDRPYERVEIIPSFYFWSI